MEGKKMKKINSAKEFRKLQKGTVVICDSNMGMILHQKIGRDRTLIIENSIVNYYIGEIDNIPFTSKKKGEWYTNIYTDKRIQSFYDILGHKQ